MKSVPIVVTGKKSYKGMQAYKSLIFYELYTEDGCFTNVSKETYAATNIGDQIEVECMEISDWISVLLATLLVSLVIIIFLLL